VYDTGMTIAIMVQVTEDDTSDLQTLLETANSTSPLIEARPFDGESVVQVMLILTPATFAALKTWIRSRAEQRKAFKIAYNGIELSGYTPAEAEQLLNRIELDVKADGPAAAK
jgi:hypothetical protein